MLNGATQRILPTRSTPQPSNPNRSTLDDSLAFDARAAGLSTVMRDAGTMVMFAGTPYAHLHICGSPWEGANIVAVIAASGR